MNISGIRTVGLALVTLVGAAHLSTAEATPLTLDECDRNAISYAQGYCDGRGTAGWSSVTYTCVGGQAQVSSVRCQGDPQEQEETIG